MATVAGTGLLLQSRLSSWNEINKMNHTLENYRLWVKSSLLAISINTFSHAWVCGLSFWLLV